MTETHSLLKDFAENGSETAFRQLVANYIDLVYSTALRKTGGDTHRAEDITQQVFADLARKARELPADVKLGGWLHRHCCFAVKMFHRTEMRRVANEREAMAMNALQPDEPAWRELEPILDDGIEQLDEEDREAIVLRFFESKNFREIGEVLGASDNAAQKRVSRALEKLRDHLAKAGATLTVAALAEHLAARSVSAAPAALLGRVNAFALKAGRAEGAATTAAVGTGLGLMGLWKVAALIGIVTAGLFLATRKSEVHSQSANASSATAPKTDAGLQQTAVAAPTAVSSNAPATVITATETNLAGLKLTILAADSDQPVPNVPIEYRGWEGRKFVGKKLAASRAGLCVVPISSNLSRLELTTHIEGFADTRLQWKPETGEKIPEAYTLKLARGVKIGGKVVDARGDLVPGAKVGFNLHPDPEAMLRTESHEFTWIELTAEDGHWETDRITEVGLRRIYGSAQHPKYVGSEFVSAEQNPKLIPQLKSLEHTFVLGDAVIVHGSVANENGDPIEGAEVLVGNRGDVNSRTGKTARDGRFSIEGCKPGKTLLTASAKKYAAKTINIDAIADSDPIKITLGPGYVLKMRVVGKSGEPVKNAYVWLNTFSRGAPGGSDTPLIQADFSPRTDAQGRVSWFEAPAKELIFDIQGAGYMRLNEVKVAADGEEHTITLQPALTIFGTVRDAETGAPIPKFRIISGWQQQSFGTTDPASAINEWSALDRFWFTFSDGKFEQLLEEPAINGIPNLKSIFRFEADGYAPEISRVVTQDETKARLDIAMKRQAISKLLVRGVDGNPAANVDVIFAEPQRMIRLQNGVFSRNGGSLVRTTDANGEVAWDSNPKISLIAAADAQGFAKISPLELGALPVLQLAPWGRVEGKITKHGKPLPGWKVQLNSSMADAERFLLENTQTTDDNGAFTIEHAPTGKYKLVRLAPFAENSYTHVELRDVSITAGQTARADYEDTRVSAVLRIVWPKDFPDSPDYRVQCTASLIPPGWSKELMNDPQRLAAWQQSPEVKAAIEKAQPVGFSPKTGRLFEAESIPPGKYHVSAFVAAKDGSLLKESLMGGREVEIPEQSSAETIDLGELALAPGGALQ